MLISDGSIRSIFTGYKALFNKAFSETESHFQKIAMEIPSSSSEETYAWLGNNTVMREWIGQRVIQNLKAHGYTIKNVRVESTVAVSREDIEDDRYGLFGPMILQLGQVSKQHPDKLIFNLMKNGFSTPCYDGQNFFDTDHPVGINEGTVSVSNFGGGTGEPWFLIDASGVIKPFIFQKRRDYAFVSLDKVNDQNVFMHSEYLYGVDARVNAGYGLWQMAYASKQTLDEANLSAAISAMKNMRADNGDPLGVKPTHLVCSPNLELAARKLIVSSLASGGESNALAGICDLIVTPWII